MGYCGSSSRNKMGSYTLSINPNITWDIVDAHPEIEWDYFFLSSNEMYYWQDKQNTGGYVLK